MRRAILSAVAVGLAIGVALIGLVVAGAINGSNREPPEKQAVETAQAIREATAQAVPHGSKDTTITPVVRTSCPVDPTTIKTQITPPIHQPPRSPIFDQVTLLSEGTVVGSDGAPYSLWLAVSATDSEQGVIIVWQGVKDPCAEGRSSLDPQAYPVPFKGRPSTFTRIDAGTVTFQDSDGTTGTFDYVNKAFSVAER